MRITVCYVTETDNKVIGYLLENNTYIPVEGITPALIESVDNMYYNRKIGHFVRNANIANNVIRKVPVGSNMPKEEFAELPPKLVEYVAEMAAQYRQVDSSSGTMSAELMPNTIFNAGNTNGLDMLKICRTLRRAAQNNSLDVDLGSHNANGGRSAQLFSYIEACGYSIKEFIYNYMRCIQPCMLRFANDDLKYKGAVCILDVFYRFELLIKYEKRDNGTTTYVVSFHESNRAGKLQNNISSGGLLKRKQYTAVLTDSMYRMDKKDAFSYYKFSITRGFARWRLSMNGDLLQPDVAIVDTNDFLDELQKSITSSLTNIINLLGYDAQDTIRLLQTASKESFSVTAYGGNVLNNLRLLMEVSTKVRNDKPMYNFVCEAFMTIFSFNMPLTDWDKTLQLLKDRYFLEDVGHNNLMQLLNDAGKRFSKELPNATDL